MAQPLKDSFLDLEKHRQLLEANIEKLKQSLRHWQTWEAEYEGLKEEILAAEPPPNRVQLVAIGQSYEGQLVTQKEVKDILGSDGRSAAQVVNLLDRRIDYVEQNVVTTKKQITAAANKLAAAIVISTPDVRNEEGLPMTEIFEELDEEGNVIASHTTTPGSARPQLLEVLKKAGVTEIPDLEVSSTADTAHSAVEELEDDPSRIQENVSAPPSMKKSVHFTTEAKPVDTQTEKSSMAIKLDEIMKQAKESDEINSGPPIIPADESPEDAALRREMLQYGMSEVGSVVAELDLEDGSEWSEDDYDGGSTDDEDQFGRTTGKAVDDELRDRMIELEKRLGVRMMENVGQKDVDPDTIEEGIGRVTISKPAEVSRQSDSKKILKDNSAASSAKKSVRFSEDLDVSPAPLPPIKDNIGPAKEWIPAPVTDIIERTQVAESAKAPLPKRVSKFKSLQTTTPKVLNGPLMSTGSSLPLTPLKPKGPKPFSQPISLSAENQEPRTAPTGPEGRTLASEVVERDVPTNVSTTAPDELEPQLLHQEVATEYHRIRNRMIQKQGGFAKEEESELIPLTEEEGGPKRMSRFRAARLARS